MNAGYFITIVVTTLVLASFGSLPNSRQVKNVFVVARFYPAEKLKFHQPRFWRYSSLRFGGRKKKTTLDNENVVSVVKTTRIPHVGNEILAEAGNTTTISPKKQTFDSNEQIVTTTKLRRTKTNETEKLPISHSDTDRFTNQPLVSSTEDTAPTKAQKITNTKHHNTVSGKHDVKGIPKPRMTGSSGEPEQTRKQTKPTSAPHKAKTKEYINKCTCDENHGPKPTAKDDITHFAYKMLKNYRPDVTSQSNDQKHYRLADYIVKYIFKHYPEYQVPLLTKVFANNTKHQAFSGMIMEFQQPNNYDVLVTDSFSQVNDGSLRRVEHYPSLYQCSKAIRYCSINPKFCQFQEGDYNTNIIIVIPHGGHVKPQNIPERMPGCFVEQKCIYALNCGSVDPIRCPVSTRPEKFAKKVGLKLAYHLKNLTGNRPHVVIMDLHRSILDADRFQDEGAFNDVTRSAWYDFHNFISLAKLKMTGHGLLIDVHSHIHKHGLVELSYAVQKPLSTKGRDKVDMKQSSLRSLVETFNIDSERILRGNLSLGSLLQKRLIESNPSINFPEQEISGYNKRQTITRLYGSLYGGTIDAIRISVPRKYGTKKQVKIFSKLMAESIKEFMVVNYK